MKSEDITDWDYNEDDDNDSIADLNSEDEDNSDN